MHARAHSDGGNRQFIAASAAVILREDGEVFECQRLFPGTWTNNHVEYHGVILSMEASLKNKITSLEMYVDSELVVNHLTERYELKSDKLRPLYERALDLASRFENISIEHVPRAHNQYADLLCNRAMDQFLGVIAKRSDRKLKIVRMFPPSGVGTIDGVVNL